MDRGQFVHQRLAVAAGSGHRAAQPVGAQGVERLEAEFLQLDAQVVHAETIGDGRVEVERLARDAAAFLEGHHAQCAHVVQPVGELHQE